MNDKLTQLQNFLQAKQVPMTVKEMGEVINFVESIKTPAEKPKTPDPKGKK